MAKGPYHRLIGQNTQRFCTRAAAKAVGEEHKRAMFITAAGADEYLAGLLGLSGGKGGPSGPSGIPGESDGKSARPGKSEKGDLRAALAKKVTGRQTAAAMRAYASAALILLGPDKERVLASSGIGEAEWMQRWCFAFEYQPGDMRLFNEALLPAYQHGLDGLAATAAKAMSEALFPGGNEEFQADVEALKKSLLHDVTAILNRK